MASPLLRIRSSLREPRPPPAPPPLHDELTYGRPPPGKPEPVVRKRPSSCQNSIGAVAAKLNPAALPYPVEMTALRTPSLLSSSCGSRTGTTPFRLDSYTDEVQRRPVRNTVSKPLGMGTGARYAASACTRLHHARSPIRDPGQLRPAFSPPMGRCRGWVSRRASSAQEAETGWADKGSESRWAGSAPRLILRVVWERRSGTP